MSTDEFIFSNKPAHRLTRHLVFWTIYCTSFWLQSFAAREYSELYESDAYYFAFLNMCAFAPVFILLVYNFIYFLLPLLRQHRYIHFLFYFIISYLAGTFINYYMAGIFLNNVDYPDPVEPNFQHRIEFGNYNTRWGMIIAIIALGIKLSKDWYLQQRENLEILKKKTRTEMQLQKARLHPDLLFRSLDTIYLHIQAGSSASQSLILHLSDLLSFSLYESERQLVPVEKELKELQHLISLEKLNNVCSIDLTLESKCDLNTRFIRPMALVKLLQGCISFRNEPGSFFNEIALNISVADQLTLKLAIINLKSISGINNIGNALTESLRKILSEHYSQGACLVQFNDDKSYPLINIISPLEILERSDAVPAVKLNTGAHEHA